MRSTRVYIKKYLSARINIAGVAYTGEYLEDCNTVVENRTIEINADQIVARKVFYLSITNYTLLINHIYQFEKCHE